MAKTPLSHFIQSKMLYNNNDKFSTLAHGNQTKKVLKIKMYLPVRFTKLVIFGNKDVYLFLISESF
jgi:hypothetical protein